LKKISAPVIHHIRLGTKGIWAEECIKKGFLKLGFDNTNHIDCVKKRWGKVRKSLEKSKRKKGKKIHNPTISKQLNNIKTFYEEDEDALWITFHGDSLWYCKSRPKIKLLSDNNKTRPVLGKWKNKDVKGNQLQNNTISTAITQIRRVPSTMVNLNEKASKRLLNIINCEKPQEVNEVQESLKEFRKKLKVLIQDLHEKDFELLIDLIFRQGGWFRTSPIGKTQETLDLDLESPITKEKILVQIKSRSDRREFLSYQKKFKDMKSYSKKFFVVHTPSKDLINCKSDKNSILWLLDDVVNQVIDLGLTKWLLSKSV